MGQGKMTEHDMDDKTLNQILGLASAPPAARDFAKNMLKNLPGQITTTSNVIAFPKRKARSNWLIGLPLAACLVLGVWLGVNGEATGFFTTTTAQTAATESLSPSGVDDIENLKLEDLS